MRKEVACGRRFQGQPSSQGRRSSRYRLATHARRSSSMFTRKLIPTGCCCGSGKRERRPPVGVVARCSVYAMIIINVAPFLLARTSFPFCLSLSLATAALRLPSQPVSPLLPRSLSSSFLLFLLSLGVRWCGRARSFPAVPLISRFVCAFKHRLSERCSKTRYRGKTS